jgi:hypothetical protein
VFRIVFSIMATLVLFHQSDERFAAACAQSTNASARTSSAGSRPMAVTTLSTGGDSSGRDFIPGAAVALQQQRQSSARPFAAAQLRRQLR